MAAPNLRTLFQIIGITLVEESVSGLRDDLYKGTDILAPGDRVMHGKHGLGVVMRTSPEGRLSVTFDSGSVHVYKRSSVAKKITRAPIDAPSPPESLQQQPIAALNSSKRRRSSTTPTARRSVIVRPGRKSVASNQGLDVVEVGRLLLYLNDETWKGADGEELAETVRAARPAGRVQRSLLTFSSWGCATCCHWLPRAQGSGHAAPDVHIGPTSWRS
jgi:hypothetical protein